MKHPGDWPYQWRTVPHSCCPAKGGSADRPEKILKDPIGDLEPLSSRCSVRSPVVDAYVHSSIDDLVLRLREANEGTGLLQRMRIGGPTR